MEAASQHTHLKPRVLVIDADSAALRRMHSVLDEEYEVHLASSVSLALLLLSEFRYKLILTSLALPSRYAGVNIVRVIRTKPFSRRTPVVALAAPGDEPDLARELDGWLEDAGETGQVRAALLHFSARSAGRA